MNLRLILGQIIFLVVLFQREFVCRIMITRVRLIYHFVVWRNTF